jgi:NAD(P)-dependent dehydrogenase (short-subunit alcohol dehydrogenase family)
MDLRGKTFVITGANSGLGAVTARAIASAGGRVIMACRDVEKGNAVTAEIGKSAQVRQLDLADLASVRQFAASLDEVDTLINNAGVMAAFAQSAQAGARSEIFAATGPVEPGGYYGPKRLRGYPRRVNSSTKSHDAHLAAKLWQISEELTGVRYPL